MPEEIKQDVVLKTQKYLGKYVKKPPLSEKLLKKPPFRFLHDIINTVIKETGFLKGLFTDEELNSENVKEKEAKVAFLTKLIDAIKVITKTELAVRPSKIVAGLEPTETNILLQTIGKAIERKTDSSEYVKQLHSGQIVNNDKVKKSKKPSERNDNLKKSSKIIKDTHNGTTKIKEKQNSNETPKSTDRDKSKTKRTTKDPKSKVGSDDGKTKTKEKEKTKKKEVTKEIVKKESKEKVETPKPAVEIIPEKQTTAETNEIESTTRSYPDEESVKTSTNLQNIEADANVTEATEPRKRSASASRPKSARPKSGDLKEKSLQDELKEVQARTVQSRPKSSLRPPSVRPSSARPGAPRLRPDSALPIKEVVPMGKINVIVESFDKDDEEETVVIQSNPETVEEQVESITEVTGNKGHLVEQILEQINESDVKVNANKTEDDWQKEVFQGKDTTTKETNNLKSLIQTLTKTANPLGKLLNYLHEDIDAMHAELEMWTNTKRQLFDEISKQKKISSEMNKPLMSQLEHLNQEIKKMEEEIVSTRSNILRNDAKIKELLAKY